MTAENNSAPQRYTTITIRIFQPASSPSDALEGIVEYPVELTVEGWRTFPVRTLHLDAARLLALQADPKGYGLALGRLLFSSEALGAASMGMALRIVFISVIMGLSNGGTALVSRHIGAKEQAEADRATQQTELLILIASVALAAIGYVLAPQLLGLMGAEAEMLTMSAAYARIIFLGLWAMELIPSMGSLLRGAGSADWAFRTNLVSTAAILLLQPLLTLGWGQFGPFYHGNPVFVIAVTPLRYSWRFLEQVGEFVIAVPDDSLQQAVRHCGTTSGRDHDKFAAAGLTAVPSVHVRAPSIRECPINIECRVYTKIAPPHMLLTPEHRQRPVEQHRENGGNQLALHHRRWFRAPGRTWIVGKRVQIPPRYQRGPDDRACGRADYRVGRTQINSTAAQFSGQSRHPRSPGDAAPTQNHRTPNGLTRRSIGTETLHAAILTTLTIAAGPYGALPVSAR